ncbi:hypothetical protein [Dankookia sp. P2]|uniref:hypothetical protein n=1 Tax=Dankookia sp. P2 TaxID=3423955 RepID=UPI003D6728F4
MVDVMTQAARWERFDGRSKKWIAIDAPMKVAATYRQRVGHWLLPVLAGLINAPTLRADGSVLAAEGYDRATGLLLNMDGAEFPTIPDQPSEDDAAAALRVLEELIATFPLSMGPAGR